MPDSPAGMPGPRSGDRRSGLIGRRPEGLSKRQEAGSPVEGEISPSLEVRRPRRSQQSDGRRGSRGPHQTSVGPTVATGPARGIPTVLSALKHSLLHHVGGRLQPAAAEALDLRAWWEPQGRTGQPRLGRGEPNVLRCPAGSIPLPGRTSSPNIGGRPAPSLVRATGSDVVSRP